MSAPTPAGGHIPDRRLERQWSTRTLAASVMGAAAIGVWWPVFGSGALWAVPILVWALLIATRLVAPKGRWEEAAVGLSWVVWVPLAALLVGLPSSILNPAAFGDTMRELLRGLRGATEGDGGPWALAGWLAFVGVWWVRGAVNATRPGNGPAAWAFLYFASPFVLALAFGRAEDAPWHGAALLVGALLWATAGGLRSALPAVALVAVVATIGAAVIGTEERHFTYRGEAAANGEVDWNLSFGPNTGARTGARYFEISSDRPALWRSRVLDRWDGRTFQPGIRDPRSDLAQPRGVPSIATVTIQRFRDVRVVGAGRILSVSGPPTQRSALGEGMQFSIPPRSGIEYTVTSQVVDASSRELAQVPIPAADDPALADYVQLFPSFARSPRRFQPRLEVDREALINSIPGWSQVNALSASLAEGATSQLEVVRRVNAYLTNPAHFRYSLTDVPPAGSAPIITFLTSSRVGYCQHFAGAAALLLRLAGIPTRVAVGFATGKSIGNDRYSVTDADAHAWIEVYFKGYGWVPFNPTPASSDVRVADGVDRLEADDAAAGGAGGGASRTIGLVVLGGMALVVGALLVRRLRRRAGDSEALADVLVTIVPGPSRPSTTVSAIGPDLAKLGPSVQALGEVAQRERFDPDTGVTSHPRRAVWHALRADVGLLRAARLMLFGAPRRSDDAGGVHGVATPPTPGSTHPSGPPPNTGSSVAPPKR